MPHPAQGAGDARDGWEPHNPPPRRTGLTVVALIAGLTGLAASLYGVAVALLPRQFTVGQAEQIMAWETGKRWRTWPAGKIFPPEIGYQLPAGSLGASSGLKLTAHREGIGTQAPCAAAADRSAGQVLDEQGCIMLLRATYADATGAFVTTVGIAVLPSSRASGEARDALTAPPSSAQGASPRASPGQGPGVHALAVSGTLAAGFAAIAVLLLVLSVLYAAPAGAAPADSVRDAQQWVLDAVHAPQAWTASQGRGVTVAVLDSGVLPGVSDLQGSVITGPDFTHAGTPHTNPAWGQHGTWMASLIAGHGHGPSGDSGVLGVAPQSRILSLRVITDKEDPAYQQYQHQSEAKIQQWLAGAIEYAVSHGSRVISMSIGYSAPSLPVRQALQDALQHGAVVVASSGNAGQSSFSQQHSYAPYAFPADYPGVLTVAATAQGGSSADFSSSNQSVQVAAPGVSVPAQGRDGQYWLVSGTSPACALVSGIAALIKSAYPALPPALVDQAITSTATGRPAHAYDDQVGFGIADAAAALARAGQLMRYVPSAGGTAMGWAGEVSAPAGSARGPAQKAPPTSAQSYFGGGPGRAGAPPVPLRGEGPLLLFAVLGFTSLALSVAAFTRLAVLRRSGSGPTDHSGPGPAAGQDQAGPGPAAGPWSAPP